MHMLSCVPDTLSSCGYDGVPGARHGLPEPVAWSQDTAIPVRCSEYLDVDGSKLFRVTDGAVRRAPALLWLHGGPGGPERLGFSRT